MSGYRERARAEAQRRWPWSGPRGIQAAFVQGAEWALAQQERDRVYRVQPFWYWVGVAAIAFNFLNGLGLIIGWLT